MKFLNRTVDLFELLLLEVILLEVTEDGRVLKIKCLLLLLTHSTCLRGDMVVQSDLFSLSNQDFAFRVI